MILKRRKKFPKNYLKKSKKFPRKKDDQLSKNNLQNCNCKQRCLIYQKILLFLIF